MLYERDNEANNAELSKNYLKQESDFGNKNDLINTIISNSEVTFNVKYVDLKEEKLEDTKENNTFNEINENIFLHKGSFAHNLHPNIEVFAHSLIEKIDTLQQSQLDIHNVEIITDRAFHSVEKLKYEIKDVKDYIQKIESRNKKLEAKIDILITQNEAINDKYIQLQTMCERFFSNPKDWNSEDVNSHDNLKTTINKNANHNTVNNFNIDTKNYKNGSNLDLVYKQIDINHNAEKNDTDDIKDLMQSKKQIEKFIKKNYPKDYLKIKQYNKPNIFNWVNRVLGFNWDFNIKK